MPHGGYSNTYFAVRNYYTRQIGCLRTWLFFPGGCLELNFWLMFNITCSPKYKMQYVKRAMIMVFFSVYCIQQVNIFSLQYLLIWAINQPSIKHISTIHQPSNNHSSSVMGACLSGFWQNFMAYGADFQRVNPQHFLGIPWAYLGHTLRIVFF